MTKYNIYASEVVIYKIPVEAKSKEEAEDLVFSGQVDFNHEQVVDSSGFEITAVEKV